MSNPDVRQNDPQAQDNQAASPRHNPREGVNDGNLNAPDDDNRSTYAAPTDGGGGDSGGGTVAGTTTAMRPDEKR